MEFTKRSTLLTTGSLLLCSMFQVNVAQAEAEAEAKPGFDLLGGKAFLDLRYRLESVDEPTKMASASTLRTRLAYKTAEAAGIGAFFQVDNISLVGDEKYNSTVNGLATYSTVVDPTGTDLNQGYLSYGAEGLSVKAGRQEIVLDNARFVGNVGWRQNPQSFDALTVKATPSKELGIFYGYVNNVYRIFGADSPKAESALNTHLLNVAYSGLQAGKLTGYAYLDDNIDAGAQSQTMGLRFAGANQGLSYTAEFASQSTSEDATTTTNSATYSLLELGYKAAGITTKLGSETLGGDGTYGFTTSYATGHAFNGWADKFLGTPDEGLTDNYLSVVSKVAGVKLVGAYHSYSAVEGSATYGSELNLLAVKKFSPQYSLLLKYASYTTDAADTTPGTAHTADAEKVWLMAQAKF